MCPLNVQIILCDYFHEFKTGVCFCRVYIQLSKQFTQYSTDRIWAFKQPPRHNSVVGKAPAPAIPDSFELKTKKSVCDKCGTSLFWDQHEEFSSVLFFTTESDGGGLSWQCTVPSDTEGRGCWRKAKMCVFDVLEVFSGSICHPEDRLRQNANMNLHIFLDRRSKKDFYRLSHYQS